MLVSLFAALPIAIIFSPSLQGAPNQETAAEPWSSTQAISASEFASELAGGKNRNHSTIVFVGFRILFEGGHVPGASYHGTASTESGLASLKKWAGTLPKDANLVIYCGCCPFAHCPNIRPAYKLLHQMGFAHIRVLDLPTSFAADWVEKGFPIQKGL
ncbi:MAG TPA: hypothetical protein VJN93_17370 [Candidatus Acidoferrum sp.]|nr:hypothetical protein [Candidatus Acidoferrum sp.]